MFCKHEWELKDKTILPSAFEQISLNRDKVELTKSGNGQLPRYGERIKDNNHKEGFNEMTDRERIRTEICNSISEMLDNPDENGIYPTTKCYDRLEAFILSERRKAFEEAVEIADKMIDNGDERGIAEALKRKFTDGQP